MKRLSIMLVLLFLAAGFMYAGGQQDAAEVDETGADAKVRTEMVDGEKHLIYEGKDYGSTGGLDLPLVDEPITVTHLVAVHPSTGFDDDWPVWDYIEEITNIKYEFLTVPQQAVNDKVQLLYSTGSLPDLFVVPSTDAINNMGVKGGIAALSDYWDVMPNYSSYLEEHSFEKSELAASDGKIYDAAVIGFPPYRLVWLYRADIFKELGIEMIPETTDELYTVLKQLKEEYPDTYPLISRQGIGLFNEVSAQWKTGKDMYLDRDADVWRFGPIEDNYRAMLEYFHKLYDEELLDTEWLSLTAKQWEDKIINDEAFVSFDWIYRIDSMRTKALDANPTWQLKALPPIYKPGVGQQKVMQRLGVSLNINGYAVSANSKYKEEVFALLDFLTSPAGQNITTFGKLGETAEILSDGTWTYTDIVRTNQNVDGEHHFSEYYGFTNYGTRMVWPEDHYKIAWFSDEFHEAYNMYEENNWGMKLKTKPKFSQEENEIVTEIESALTDYCDSMTAKFVVNGNFEDWDDYVDEVKSMKVDELVTLYNERYKK